MEAPERGHAGDHGEALRNTDPEIHQERKARGLVLARLEIELIDPEQDRAAPRSARETTTQGLNR